MKKSETFFQWKRQLFVYLNMILFIKIHLYQEEKPLVLFSFTPVHCTEILLYLDLGVVQEI